MQILKSSTLLDWALHLMRLVGWGLMIFGAMTLLGSLMRGCDDATLPAAYAQGAPVHPAMLQARYDELTAAYWMAPDPQLKAALRDRMTTLEKTLTEIDRTELAANTMALTAAPEPPASYRLEDGLALPDPDLTPGAVNPDAIADLSGKPHKVHGLEMNLCAKDFRATAVRKTITNFAGLKKKACAEYGLDKCDASVEGDHLISIEIGGCPDCLTNIWPQPMDEARKKDHQLEDVLPGLICSGKMTLPAAQKCIASDWVACAKRIDGTAMTWNFPPPAVFSPPAGPFWDLRDPLEATTPPPEFASRVRGAQNRRESMPDFLVLTVRNGIFGVWRGWSGLFGGSRGSATGSERASR
jgi:hypothetical protein